MNVIITTIIDLVSINKSSRRRPALLSGDQSPIIQPIRAPEIRQALTGSPLASRVPSILDSSQRYEAVLEKEANIDISFHSYKR